MFVLVTLEETVLIPPNKLHLPLHDSLIGELNDKLANKVIVNVGLCITLYDLLQVGQSFLHHGDPSSHTKVKFRFVVFRPFVGETVVGKIRACSVEGIHVSLNFFENILIPAAYLQETSRFEEKDQLWVWEYQDEEDGQKHDMKMELNEKIRFKIKEEIFKDTSPPGPTNPDIMAEDRLRKAPYTIIGSCAESGLGMLSWWK